MCGIWGYILTARSSLCNDLKLKLYSAFLTLKHRGPDRSDFSEFDLLVPFFLGFHRLAVMDQSSNGDQPFVCEWEGRTIYSLCNGELYNYKDLVTKYGLPMTSTCDCEVIPLLYRQAGIGVLLEEIKGGEFAFIILDVDKVHKTVTLHVGHDPAGVRPLYYGVDSRGMAFSSELAGLLGVVEEKKIKPFPPGTVMTATLARDGSLLREEFRQYYSFDGIPPFLEPKGVDVWSQEYVEAVCLKVRTTLESCVIGMLKADRPLGALLSGGLDSSLVVGIAAKYLRENCGGKRLRTFSIGMPGGTDGPYAQKVANFCGTDHTHFELSTEDFLTALPSVIGAIGTYDITTIRASVGQYLVSQKISEGTDIKVLLIGDGSDELCSGYMYFHKAPSPTESHWENARLLREIGLYDVLRADRCIAHHGLEARVPFLAHAFMDLYLKTDVRLRIPHEGVEKWLLRKAFEGEGIIPDEIRLRAKCAFSDGVSRKEKSWFQIIGDSMGSKTPSDFEDAIKEFESHVPPVSPESLFYRRTFHSYFGDTAHVIPHFWMPKWCGDIKEPSARVLDVTQAREE